MLRRLGLYFAVVVAVAGPAAKAQPDGGETQEDEVTEPVGIFEFLKSMSEEDREEFLQDRPEYAQAYYDRYPEDRPDTPIPQVPPPVPVLNWLEFRDLTGGNIRDYRRYRDDYQVYHPADANRDHVIDNIELDFYTSAWQSGYRWEEHDGQRIPIDSLTQAAQINWDFDGLYFYFGDHFVGVEEVEDTYGSYAGVIITNIGGSMPATKYTIYKPANVRVALNDPETWTAMAVEEILPEGWTAEAYVEQWETPQHNTRILAPDISREDRKNASLTVTEQDGRCVVRWGPFDWDHIKEGDYPGAEQERLLRYAIQHPNGLLPANDQFEGVQSYDGVSRPTLERDIKPAWEYHYPQYNDFGVNVSDADVEVPNVNLAADANGDGRSNLLAWIQRGSPEARVHGLEPTFEVFEEDGERRVRCVFYQAFESDYIQRIFLRSTNLKAWYRINAADITITPLPELDRGAAKAYEADFPASGSDSEYFKLLYRESFYRTPRSVYPLISVDDYFSYFPLTGYTINETHAVVLSASSEEFEIALAPNVRLVLETKLARPTQLVVNDSEYTVSPYSYLRIDNPGSEPLTIRRDADRIIVEDIENTGVYYDDSELVRGDESSDSSGLIFVPMF